MNKTHKKILGFAGLGLVAALTTVAAFIPAPANAMGSYTDIIQVHVDPTESDITLSSPFGSEVHEPNYDFEVAYTGITDITVTIVNRDSSGNVIFGPVELWHTDLNWQTGSKGFNLNLDELGGYGEFTITANGSGVEGVPVEKILQVKYTDGGGGEIIDPDTPEPDPGTGDIDVKPEIPEEKVTTTDLNIYNSAGVLVKGGISISNPSDIESVDLSDLPDGVYDGEIISKNGYGDVIEVKHVTIVIDRGGGAGDIDVPIDNTDPEVTRVTMTLRDSNDNIIGSVITLDEPIPSSAPINIDSLPAGIYTLTTDYYKGDKLVNRVVTTFTKSDTEGKINIKIDTEVDTVATIKAEVYDENGNVVRRVEVDRKTGTVYIYGSDGGLIKTIEGGYTDGGSITVPFEGLPWGEYEVKVSFWTKDNRQVGKVHVYKVSWYGTVPVPDTGSFFQNLNISREDYLITGLIVFMVVGVVAFGVVARNRKSKTVGKKSRK